MKIFFEGYSYDPEVVRDALPDSKLLLTNEKVKIEHVGYYRSPACDDFVFFLPKVLLEPVRIDGRTEDRVFCVWNTAEDGTRTLVRSLKPEDIVNLPSLDADEETRTLTAVQCDFLYEFSVWVYRAIAHFDETHKDSGAVWKSAPRQSGAFRRRYVTNTLLDVVLALLRFNRDNQDYFLFKIREMHSGFNRINWTRTIAHSPAIVQDGVPVYLTPRNRRKQVDFDEELLVIYYSILSYVRRHFGFPVTIRYGYSLIPDGQFDRYLSGYGTTRLRQIKYKYFSDRDLLLWELCFAFFDRAHKANVVGDREEYLLAKDFNIVFEAMIDELLGDPELAKFKELEDGKEIDHLYVDDSLTRRDLRAFYIADSKYYKIGNALGQESVAKQFTYAKDMLQLNLDLFLPDGDLASDRTRNKRRPFEARGASLQRDPLTESYDVIPNFFISATVDGDLDYDKGDVVRHNYTDNTRYEFQNIHFQNRLFDRDTLILLHYDVNFLYVLKMYVQNEGHSSEDWRVRTRRRFRRDIQDNLTGHYSFYAILPREGDAEAFFTANFRHVLGKVHAPYLVLDGRPVYLLALEKPGALYENDALSRLGRDERIDFVRRENAKVLDLVDGSFYRIELKTLGDDPSVQLRAMLKS